MKQAYLGHMFEKTSNSILCNSGISWRLEPTPPTSSVYEDLRKHRIGPWWLNQHTEIIQMEYTSD